MRSTEATLAALRARLLEVNDLESAAALLHWDQTTYMPPGGAAARGRQLATLSRLAHARFTDPAIGALLDDLTPHAERLPFDDDDASLIRVTRREYERAVKVPPEYTARLHEHGAASYAAWVEARPANDFRAVRPFLEKTLDLSRELAEFFPGYAHVADPLIDFSDPGMTVAATRALFGALRDGLKPLVEAIAARPGLDASCLNQPFDRAAQRAFAESVVRGFGYDFRRGRLDPTAHPFMTKFSLDDVRITTRYKDDELGDALFSSMHEAGHALYEQGIDPAFEGTPLGCGTSSGVHESQSRLWENFVGRGRRFWTHFYPRLQEAFPAQFGAVKLQTFHHAVNKVAPSLIRTDADEVTYNLHVMIRFELESQLLEGKLAVRDLPDAWRARYRDDLGVAPPDDRDGALQDVHWFAGLIGGAFQGYTLGNIIAAQVFAAALDAHPRIPSQIERGEFDLLRAWLRENVYRHGSKYTANELLQRVVGGPLDVAPLLRHLRAKYGRIYRL